MVIIKVLNLCFNQMLLFIQFLWENKIYENLK